MANAIAIGEFIRAGIASGLAGVDGVKDVRGMGLMIGVELDRPCGELVQGRACPRAAHQRHRRQRGAPAAAARDEQSRGAASPGSTGAAHRRLPDGRRPPSRQPAEGYHAPLMQPVRHFLQFKDFSREEFEYLFERTRWIKEQFKRYERYWPLRGPHARDDLREAVHAHAAVVRGRHASARRRGDLPQHARHPARARRAGRGRGAGDLAHGGRRHDPHLRAGDHRAFRRAIRACR